MKEAVTSKKWGIGSISLVISIFSIMFSFTYVNGKNIGQYILNTLAISFPYVFISLILFVVSIFIGYKNNEDHFAIEGMILSIIFIVLIVILSIASALFV